LNRVRREMHEAGYGVGARYQCDTKLWSFTENT